MPVRLVAFDVDGTLTRSESIWQVLHKAFDTRTKAEVYKKQFFRNEITYSQWAALDASLWQNQPVGKALDAVRLVPVIDGAKETVDILAQHKIYTAILSGGLDILADRIAEKLGIPIVVTNELMMRDDSKDLLSGEVCVRVSWDNKAKHLSNIAQDLGVSLDECVFVGDGLNDIPPFQSAGISIAVNPTDEQVARAATFTIRECTDLRQILPLILKQRTIVSSRSH